MIASHTSKKNEIDDGRKREAKVSSTVLVMGLSRARQCFFKCRKMHISAKEKAVPVPPRKL